MTDNDLIIIVLLLFYSIVRYYRELWIIYCYVCMSMQGKYQSIWCSTCVDDAANIVFEHYSVDLDKIYIIYKRKDGLYMPFSFVKGAIDHQWSLPFWGEENTKVIFALENQAIEYLSEFYGLTHNKNLKSDS